MIENEEISLSNDVLGSKHRFAPLNSNDVRDLERRWRAAEARLRIAEIWGWTLASGASLSVYVAWPNDLLALIAFSATYFFTVRPCDIARKAAEDRLEKVMGVRNHPRVREPFGG